MSKDSWTLLHHGEERGLPHVEIEIRQDLILTAAGQAEWAQRRIARAFSVRTRNSCERTGEREARRFRRWSGACRRRRRSRNLPRSFMPRCEAAGLEFARYFDFA